MTSFTDIPYTDIKDFILQHYDILPNDMMDSYNLAWEIIKNKGIDTTADSALSDFIIAYTLVSNKVHIPDINESQIVFNKIEDLNELAQLLLLDKTDKLRIIRILSYMDKLHKDMSQYESLPDDMIELILKNLDCNDILSMCAVSTKFMEYCQNGPKSYIIRDKIKSKLQLNVDNMDTVRQLCKFTHKKFIDTKSTNSIVALNNQLYGFGDLFAGLYNIDKYTERVTQLPLVMNDIIMQVALSSDSVIILTSNGLTYSFGYNTNGTLGLSDDINYKVNNPQIIPVEGKIVGITSSYNHSLLLTASGKVYGMGKNLSKQLGRYDSTMEKNKIIPYPTIIEQFNNIVKVAAGLSHTLALDIHGDVYMLGESNLEDDVLKSSIPLHLEAMKNIKDIYSTDYMSIFIDNDNLMYLMGKMIDDFGLAYIDFSLYSNPAYDIGNYKLLSSDGRSIVVVQNRNNQSNKFDEILIFKYNRANNNLSLTREFINHHIVDISVDYNLLQLIVNDNGENKYIEYQLINNK